MAEPDDRWGTLFAVLSNPYRRQLLVALLEHNPQDDDDVDPLDLVADSDADVEVLQTELVHTHLPKLEELGVVRWDRDSGEISTGPEWEQFAPVLELLHDNRDELPDGWL